MPELAVPHPGDASRLVRVDDLLAELWARTVAAAATDKLQTDTLTDHDNRLAKLDDVPALLATIEKRLSTVENDKRTAELAAQVAALTERVAALEAESGPALGVDVSGHQTLAQVQAVAADPVNEFVIVKATEGEGWKSPDYAAQVAAVRAAGKMAGAYHFAWCNQDPLKEAANFIAGAALKPGDVVALDLERETAGETWTVRVAYALKWLTEVKAKTGATPVVYVNWSWIKGMRTAATATQWAELVKYPLWLAEWTGTAGQHSTVTSKDGTDPDSWPIVVHQYGVIDNLDRNWTPDIAALRALGVK